jgi:hypothetical protein
MVLIVTFLSETLLHPERVKKSLSQDETQKETLFLSAKHLIYRSHIIPKCHDYGMSHHITPVCFIPSWVDIPTQER